VSSYKHQASAGCLQVNSLPRHTEMYSLQHTSQVTLAGICAYFWQCRRLDWGLSGVWWGLVLFFTLRAGQVCVCSTLSCSVQLDFFQISSKLKIHALHHCVSLLFLANLKNASTGSIFCALSACKLCAHLHTLPTLVWKFCVPYYHVLITHPFIIT